MLYNERWEINLKIEGITLDYPASNLIFSLHDSIFSLYPSGNIFLNDPSGQFHEFLSLVEGTKIDFTFGTKDNTLTCPFIIIKNALPEQTVQSNFGGVVESSMIHHYFFNQNKQSAAYNDEISNIIKNKTNLYPFNSINIDATINRGLWYQPLINDSEFMINHLLPYAYSTDANNSPFYMFIDTNNDFYFKSYKKLFMDQTSIITLSLTPNSQIESLTQENIVHVNTSQVSLSELRPICHRILYSLNTQGASNSKEDKINSFPSALANQNIPIRANLDNITSLIRLLPEDTNLQTTKNNNLGFQLYSMREAFHVEKLVITTNLNINLRAGKKVFVNIPSHMDKDKTEISPRFSGEYLIESSYHKWQGRTAFSLIVVSRQTIKIPSMYRNKEELITK